MQKFQVNIHSSENDGYSKLVLMILLAYSMMNTDESAFVLMSLLTQNKINVIISFCESHRMKIYKFRITNLIGLGWFES